MKCINPCSKCIIKVMCATPCENFLNYEKSMNKLSHAFKNFTVAFIVTTVLSTIITFNQQTQPMLLIYLMISMIIIFFISIMLSRISMRATIKKFDMKAMQVRPYDIL